PMPCKAKTNHSEGWPLNKLRIPVTSAMAALAARLQSVRRGDIADQPLERPQTLIALETMDQGHPVEEYAPGYNLQKTRMPQRQKNRRDFLSLRASSQKDVLSLACDER